MRIKHGVWILGVIALGLLAHFQGIGNGSSYIQFVDGAVLIYGAGHLTEKWPQVKRALDNHHVLVHRMEHLHEKFDKHIGKEKDNA